MLNAQVFHLNPRLPPTVPLLPQICLCQAVQLEKQTNKKENQAQISKSSTERLSYKAPFKGPLIECTGVWCVLPLGDLPPPSPPPPPPAAFDTRKAVSQQEQHGLAYADPPTPHQRHRALPSPAKHLNRELRWILKREK